MTHHDVCVFHESTEHGDTFDDSGESPRTVCSENLAPVEQKAPISNKPPAPGRVPLGAISANAPASLSKTEAATATPKMAADAKENPDHPPNKKLRLCQSWSQ
jgi:hypothetical protein